MKGIEVRRRLQLRYPTLPPKVLDEIQEQAEVSYLNAVRDVFSTMMALVPNKIAA